MERASSKDSGSSVHDLSDSLILMAGTALSQWATQVSLPQGGENSAIVNGFPFHERLAIMRSIRLASQSRAFFARDRDL